VEKIAAEAELELEAETPPLVLEEDATDSEAELKLDTLETPEAANN